MTEVIGRSARAALVMPGSNEYYSVIRSSFNDKSARPIRNDSPVLSVPLFYKSFSLFLAYVHRDGTSSWR